ncbi:MAG: tRNA pseudouridine(55) synthase TruB [Lachnospiraceae bacterium]|nr:tRNA pseudouridine(55) synthase TruB [Lachnospiraceae bacterium]
MDGILNIYKEKGYTSHDVVARLRGILKVKKIGHTGTLDPDAVGVLPICVGKATKVCDLLTSQDKTYLAKVRLGITTDTLDMSGTVQKSRPVSVTSEQLESALKAFTGEISQIPPMYSAIKVNGKKLYELARKGEVIDRKPRTVTIYEIKLMDDYLTKDEFTILVTCSKGTYIRTLCADIGEMLGCGAIVKDLERIRVGDFHMEHSMTLGMVERFCEKSSPEKLLKPIDSLFEQYAACRVSGEGLHFLANGNPVAPSFCDYAAGEGETVRMYDEQGEFYALYQYSGKNKRYKVVKMFHG